jgi:hypothetical protein
MFLGQISLAAAGTSQTVITLEVHTEPKGLVQLVVDTLARRSDAVDRDISQLVQHVSDLR